MHLGEGAQKRRLRKLAQTDVRRFGSFETQLTVRIVLNQNDVVFFQDFGDLCAVFFRVGQAGRILELRNQIGQLDFVAVLL